MFCTLYLLKVLCKLKLVIRLILLRFMRLFADDACLSYQHSDPEYLNEVNKELGKVDTWLRTNKLFINYSKSIFVLFNKTSKNCEFSVKINGFLIEQSDSIKYLGVVLDDKLNWKKI